MDESKQTMLDALDIPASAGRLSSWETEFVESIEGQVATGQVLTVKQGDKLRELYERYVGRGR